MEIELKISNGEYLTHEDLEKYLNEYEDYYRGKFNKGITKFEWDEMIKDGNDNIEKTLSGFDKIELILEDIDLNDKFFLDIHFPKPSGINYYDKDRDFPHILRGEKLISYSENTNTLENIFEMNFKEFQIKNPRTPPYMEGTISKFSVPEIIFYKFDVNKPKNLKKGDRVLLNLNILRKLRFKGKYELIYLTYMETVGLSPKIKNINSNNQNPIKTNQEQTNNKSNKNCFIVTTTMGDTNHPVVVDFRRYRDEVLLNTYFGRVFIILYYKVGPVLSKVIKTNSFLFTISKNIVLRLHKLINTK